jgi:hypothetical protein
MVGKRPLGFEMTNAEGDTAAADEARRKLTNYRPRNRKRRKKRRRT